MRRRTALFASALLVALFALPASGALSAEESKTYIVQLLDRPVVTYEGGIPGLAGTKPGAGQKINPNAANVRAYLDHLRGKHDEALSKVGGAKKLYDYGVAFNGFAAQLTEAQAARMEAVKGVVSVTPDRMDPVETSTTPSFLGLTGSSGFWQSIGSVGEDVVIGVLDTGFWPENPAFSDRTGTNPRGRTGKKDYQQIPGWHGKCTPGEAFNASMCNQKVIGAQYFPQGALAGGGIPDFEFMSARDWDGHGSHTASTAGGNNGVQPTGDAAGFTPISGIAPRARLSIYKVCWELADQSTASCSAADRVAAIDQSVADGVDVLNHSIGATLTNFLDPVQIAFFNAAAAGVFVAASAGNSGPVASTVASPGPWTTSVAASTHNRTGRGSVTIDGVTYQGLSYAAAATGALVDAQDSAAAGQDPAEAALCFSAADNAGVPVLDPAKVAGKVVLCERGGNVLVNKSLAVKRAGGIGMVLTNTPTSLNTLFAIIHSVPAVHIPFTTVAAYNELKADADAGKTAAIAKFTADLTVTAPLIASFSSRGPSAATNGDILKPDISAPGVDILAAVSPAGNNGRDFDSLQGTSMSSPHIAGVAALLKQLRPTWSPMAIKSAMMTTAYDLVGISGASRTFAQGAGHVDPKKAADPGLVFDSGPAQWIAFICGTGQLAGPLCAAPPAGFGSIDPSNLNQASIAIGDLPGTQTVTRTAKSVGRESETYTFSVEGLSGLTVTPSATQFTIAPNATQQWSVTFTRTTATLDAYTTGSIVWTGDKGHVVRMPVAIRPVAVAAPREVTFNTLTGPSTWDVTTGYAGTLVASIRGLVPATKTPFTVTQDPDQTWVDCGDEDNTFVRETTIPAGTTHYRVGIYEDAITPSGTDLDMFVCTSAGLVGFSADGDSNEEVNFTFATPLASPIPITVYVHGFSTNGPSATGTLFEWAVGTADAGNTALGVSPPGSTTVAGTKTITASFTGLAANTRYMGVVRYGDGTTTFASTTVLRVNTP